VVKHGKSAVAPGCGQIIQYLERFMVVQHFKKILYVTGIITMVPIVMFFIPWQMLSVLGLNVGREAGVPFTKHWGLLAFCFGALLVYSAEHVELRRPIVVAAAVEKIGMCVIIAMAWNDEPLIALRPILFIDGICVILYGLWLLSGGDTDRVR
jgi:hypothetical protein